MNIMIRVGQKYKNMQNYTRGSQEERDYKNKFLAHLHVHLLHGNSILA